MAGSRIEHDGLLVRKATLHGVSEESRSNSYGYDVRDRIETSKAAREEGARASVEHVDAADFREALERPAGELPSLTFEREIGHKIAKLTRGSEPPRVFQYGGGAERVSDGRFRYEFDARGRLISATEELPAANPSSQSVRRVLYDYSAEGRVVGRRAEYAQPPAEWKLEDRAAILDADGLPADTTFVWDPISDRLVAVYAAGGTKLLRQIIHGASGYDDPIEVALPGGRLYPVFDEAGAGTLQVILSAAGEVVSRTVAEGAYGEDEFALAGAAIDRIAVTAKKNSAGVI
ncbi:MAG TPA: hypothetical protein VM733_08760, partial [Thermoanaerobaculia bacterium]|nr:hypothetical protein [Thermoanaerobaculia bacterium]